MKTILKLLVLAVMFTGVNSYAIEGNGDFKLHVIKNDKKLIAFSLSNVKQATISFYEKNGELIYSEKVKGNDEGILKSFSLEEFPKGDYLMKVETDEKKVIHEIHITSEDTLLSRNSVSEVYKNDLNEKNTNVAIR